VLFNLLDSLLASPNDFGAVHLQLRGSLHRSLAANCGLVPLVVQIHGRVVRKVVQALVAGVVTDKDVVFSVL